MKKIFVFIFIFALSSLFLAINVLFNQKKISFLANKTPNVTIKKQHMNITSSAFEHNGYLPSKYSCDGEGVNPPLLFSDVPKDAKSLVLIVDDPDAPMGTFVHWVLYNIDSSTTEVKENSVPSGAIEGKNSANNLHFVAACPPSGTHRYFFKLYALDEKLNLSQGANKQVVEEAIKNHILAETQIIGLYKRK